MNIGTWLIGAGLLAGFLISAQGAINGRLAGHLGGPLHAALVSFSVGWLILAVIIIATRQGAPNWSGAAGAPWWVWIGGAMGAFMVSMSATAVPRIGVAVWVSAVIAGQLTAAVVYDHFGTFGQTVREVSWPRLTGVALLAAGVYLIRRY